MLRINLEVTDSPTRLRQIEEVVVKNTGETYDGEHVYSVYMESEIVATVTHFQPNGALHLAELALSAVNGGTA